MKNAMLYTVVIMFFASCKHESNPEKLALLDALESSTNIIQENNRIELAGFEALHSENPGKSKKIYDFVQVINTETNKLLETIMIDSVSSKSSLKLYNAYKDKICSKLIYDIEAPFDTILNFEDPLEMKVVIKNKLSIFNAIIFDELHKAYSWCGPNWAVIYGDNAVTKNDTTYVELKIHFPVYKASILKMSMLHNGDSINTLGNFQLNGKLGLLKFPGLKKGSYEARGNLEFALENGSMTDEPFACRFKVE